MEKYRFQIPETFSCKYFYKQT